MVKIFMEGGAFIMSLLTIELVALLMAAWKAPGWVKEIGLLPLITGFVWLMQGLYQAAGAVLMAGDISSMLIWGGIRVSTIYLIYGFLIYGASLIIRIVQRSRLL